MQREVKIRPDASLGSMQVAFQTCEILGTALARNAKRHFVKTVKKEEEKPAEPGE